MNARVSIRLALAAALTAWAGAALAASADDFKAAYAKAEAADKQSVAMKTEWTTTVKELKAAKKAADAGNYDAAIKHANEAEALANVSIDQAKEQETAWTQAVVR